MIAKHCPFTSLYLIITDEGYRVIAETLGEYQENLVSVNTDPDPSRPRMFGKTVLLWELCRSIAWWLL